MVFIMGVKGPAWCHNVVAVCGDSGLRLEMCASLRNAGVFIFLCSMINPNLNKKLNPFTIIIVCASHPCFFSFLYFFTLLRLCVELLWRFLFRTIYMMSLMCSPQMYRSGFDHRSPINLLFKPSVSEECWLKGRLKRAMLAHFRQMNWGVSLSSTYSREVQE